MTHPPFTGPGFFFRAKIYDPSKAGRMQLVEGRELQLVGDFPSSGGISEAEHTALRQLIHLADEDGPYEGFASGAFQEILPLADPFPTSIIWWTSAAKTSKIIEEQITYNANKTIHIDSWLVYALDGTTVLHTATDTYTYSGVFVASRTRVLT